MSKKLCGISKEIEFDVDSKEFRKIVKKPKFACKKCGRVAKSDKYLCKPSKL